MFRQKLLRLSVINRVRSCKCSTDNNKTKTTSLIEDNPLLRQIAATKLITNKDVTLKPKWNVRDSDAYSLLRALYTEDSNVRMVKFLSNPKDISISGIKKWFKKRKEMETIAMQAYIPERNQILGNELAAAHFIVYRGGAIKFHGEDRWIKADQYQRYNLPTHYDGSKFLQGIDCVDVELYYEGLVNFRNLHQVEWFSVNGCEAIDDWCLDTIGNIFSDSLIYLDIRNCPKITEKGIGSLFKLRNLKLLYVDDSFCSREFEMTCLLLEELNPDLDIRLD